eukprot:920413-Amphidinium_carterae.1
MDPTVEELAGLSNMGQVCSWVSLSDESAASLLSALGVASNTHPRVVAFLTYDAFSTVVAAWHGA